MASCLRMSCNAQVVVPATAASNSYQPLRQRQRHYTCRRDFGDACSTKLNAARCSLPQRAALLSYQLLRKAQGASRQLVPVSRAAGEGARATREELDDAFDFDFLEDDDEDKEESKAVEEEATGERILEAAEGVNFDLKLPRTPYAKVSAEYEEEEKKEVKVEATTTEAAVDSDEEEMEVFYVRGGQQFTESGFAVEEEMEEEKKEVCFLHPNCM